jgi:hypothetical protein
MEVNKEGRNLYILDTTTGQNIKLKPEGILGKVRAVFKKSARIKFMKNSKGGGHYANLKGQEVYVQNAGENNCLLIAIDESLGKKVDRH